MKRIASNSAASCSLIDSLLELEVRSEKSEGLSRLVRQAENIFHAEELLPPWPS